VTSALSADLARPDRALAVGAHPDDIEFGAGATLAKWAADGCQVSFVICTDGSKGTWDPDADTAELVRTRQLEASRAARALGATGQVVFLGRVDGELENDRSTRVDLVRAIRQLQPDVLLGHDPWQRYRLHPDHRAAGFLVCDGLVAARDPHFFTELDLPHHRPRALLLFEADEANHTETVSDRDLAAKVAALESHRSQFRSTMFIADRPDEQTQRFREEIRSRATDAGGWAEVPLAERFRLMPTDR